MTTPQNQQNTQTIDISPEKVAIIANATVRFLNLESTLMPGTYRQQLAVLEVYMSALASGQLTLAPTPQTAVESDLDKDSDAMKEEILKAAQVHEYPLGARDDG